MASVRGLDAGRRRRMTEVIGAQIEPITRFTGADLKEWTPDQDSSAELVVTTRQRIDLDIETATACGQLPADVVPHTDLLALENALQQRLATAESSATARIQQWVTEDAGAYRRLLPWGSLHSKPLNETLGTEWPCTVCTRRGKLVCGVCTGGGCQTCPDCQGRRQDTCRHCRGLGRLACTACDGRGLVNASVSVPAGATGTAADPAGALVPCAACSQGWLNCSTCAGQGEQDCSRCAASGRIVCPTCAGQQELDCPDCQATGWRHRWGRLRERMAVEDKVEVHHPDTAVMDAIASRFSEITTLDQVCTLDQVRHTTAPLAVQAVHRLRLPVRQAQLQVAGQVMHFTAVGPGLETIDHQHIAAVLLAHDLATLEKNAAGSGRHLGDALQRFLQSPLNREIAARTPPAEIARQHPGMVDDAYQTRARQAAQRAIERLWLQHMRRPRLLCLVGVGLVAALSVTFGSPRLGLGSGAALGIGVGLIGWVIADWQTRRTLAQALQMPHGDRLLRPLRQSDTVRRWQAVSLAAVAVAALAGAGAMTRLPHVRQHTAQAQASAMLEQQLDAWWISEGKDYRLRRYPPTEALAQAVAQTPANPRARVVRAWQLLLGLDGMAPDARAAERLLDGLDQDPQLGTATVVGQARTTLALRSRSATALQAAALALASLPPPLEPEALHTLALVQLTPTYAARTGSLQQGLSTLQQAADLGHASACFELGRRLASGNGLRRDVAGARRYLGYAEAKGVPGAGQALAALR